MFLKAAKILMEERGEKDDKRGGRGLTQMDADGGNLHPASRISHPVSRIPPFRFLIAGAGPDRGRIEYFVGQLGLGECVELAGFMSSAEFFSRVDVLVQCSRIENLPYSVMEAMAKALPVIATAVGGLPDLVEDGKTGRLVRPNDAADLYRAMKQFSGDASLPDSFGYAGRVRLEERFAYRNWVEHHVNLYRNIATT